MLTPAERQRRYRARKRRGALAIRLDLLPRHVQALEALGLLAAGDTRPTRGALAGAVQRFLDAAEPLSLVADALNTESPH